MTNAFRFFLKLIAIFVAILSISLFATSAANASGNERLRIDFISAPDWIEISHVEKEPEELNIRLLRKNGSTIPIATFTQDGPAFPELASIFKDTLKGRQILFTIVKWRYYLSGVDTEGDYYEVHAYEARNSQSGAVSFAEVKKISDFYGSGFDGKQEGKIVHFQFKDASAIRLTLSKKR